MEPETVLGRVIQSLAERPHTFVKLSGMTAESTDPATFGIGGAFEDWVDRVRRVVGDPDWPTVSAETARRAYLPGGGSALRRVPSEGRA